MANTGDQQQQVNDAQSQAARNLQEYQSVNSSATPMAEFNPDTDQWVLYQERLENYYAACRVTDVDRKKVLLLNSIGSKAYKLVRDLSTPALPTTKTYAELCAMLDQYYTPPVVAFRERTNFYAATKVNSESIVEWMARIKFMAASCNFGNLIEGIILDKFITGLDGRAFDRICEEDVVTLTLNRAMDLASKYETRGQNSDDVVHAVNSKWRPQSKKNVHPPKEQKYASTDAHSSGPQRCKHCGFKNHTGDACKFKNATCHKCKSKGHLASVCKQRKTNHESDCAIY